MKIFISWSGERSHRAAILLDRWLSCVIQAVEPWLSSKDIDRGAIWFNEINTQLSSINNGIICLTKSNLSKPWILFEAGALAKGLSSSRVFTFLIDLESQDVKDPLGQFNHTLPNKDSLRQLVKSINLTLEEKRIKDNILDQVFDTYWPQFEDEFKLILSETPEEEVKTKINPNDLLGEIVNSVRSIERRIGKLETLNRRTSSMAPQGIFKSISNQPKDLNLRIRELLRERNTLEQIYFKLKDEFPIYNLMETIITESTNELL